MLSWCMSNLVIKSFGPGSLVIKLFPCSAQVSMKFFLLINVKTSIIVGNVSLHTCLCMSIHQFLKFLINVNIKCKFQQDKMSPVMRKPAFCICENKDADQLRGNRQAYHRLCFRHTDSTIPLLPKSEISSLQPSSVAVLPGFVSDLVGNLEDRFSHNEAQM